MAHCQTTQYIVYGHYQAYTEEDWYKRGVKEAVAIRKINPTLNKDKGRHKLSPIYDQLIRTSVAMKTSWNGAKDGSEGTDF